MYYKDTGIILNAYEGKEADRIVVLLLKKYGKQSMVFKGIKKAKSKKLNTDHMGNLVELLYYKKNDHQLPYVRDIKVKNHYYAIKKNYLKYVYLNFICELFSHFSLPNEPSERLFNFLQNILMTLKEISDHQIAKLILYIEYKLLQLIGILPELKECGHCHTEKELLYYHSEKNEVYCPSCENTSVQKSITVDKKIQHYLIQLNKIKLNTVKNFFIESEKLNDLNEIFYYMMIRYLQKDLKSYKILNEMIHNEYFNHG